MQKFFHISTIFFILHKIWLPKCSMHIWSWFSFDFKYINVKSHKKLYLENIYLKPFHPFYLICRCIQKSIVTKSSKRHRKIEWFCCNFFSSKGQTFYLLNWRSCYKMNIFENASVGKNKHIKVTFSLPAIIFN